MPKQFTLKHLAILVTLVCLGLGVYRGWYTAERRSWMEVNTGLHRGETIVFGMTTKRWVERTELHRELLEVINSHELEHEEDWLPWSSSSRQRGLTHHQGVEWNKLLAKIYSRSRLEDESHGEEIGVELLKIYLPVEKTKENIEPTRQRLLQRMNELICPMYTEHF